MTPNALPLRPRTASLSMLGGMALIGCVDNVIAPMSAHIGLWQFYILRALLAVPFILVLSSFGFGAIRPIRLWAVAARGLLMAVAMAFYFGALAYISLPQALAGLFTSPIFILLITAFALKERIGRWRIAAVAMGFVGILLVIDPWSESWSVLSLLPVVGGLLYACAGIATRTICAGEAVLSMLLGLFLAQALVGALALWILPGDGTDFILRAWSWHVPPEAWGYLCVQAVGSVLGVGLLIRAYALGEASYVTVFEYSIFIFAALFGWLFFGHIPTTMAICGIAFIALAGIVIAQRTGSD